MQGQFFDHFFFWVLIAATALTAIDWWIGPDGRARMRDKMGEWWLHVTEASFTELIAEDARRVRSWLLAIFGRWTGIRSLLLCALISILTSILLTASFAVFYDAPIVNGGDYYWLKYTIAWQFLRIALIPLVVANAIFDWVSLGVTLKFLEWMARSVSVPKLTSIVIADIVLAVCFAIAVAWVVSVYVGFFDPEQRYSSAFTIKEIREFFINFNEFLAYDKRDPIFRHIWVGSIFLPFTILFTSALPTILHLFVAAIFLGSKIFRPVLQPAIGRVLYLFHVSKKGVLTQIAVGGGVVIKVGQEAIKYMTA